MVVASLDAAAAAYQVNESSSLDDARDIATKAAELGHVVVAVGGDGTAGALAGVVAERGRQYAIIPAGHGNDFARVLGIPSDAAAAAQCPARPAGASGGPDRRHRRRPPEIVVVGSVYLGIPSMAGEIANQTRWLRGLPVYPAAALRALARLDARRRSGRRSRRRGRPGRRERSRGARTRQIRRLRHGGGQLRVLRRRA